MTDYIRSAFFLDGDDDVFTWFEQPVSARLYRPSGVTDLLTGKSSGRGVNDLETDLAAIKVSGLYSGKVVHLSYEYGRYLVEGVLPHGDPVMGVIIEYGKWEKRKPVDSSPPVLKEIKLPSRELYREKFEKLYEHLLRGDSYQFNLTFPCEMKFDRMDLESFVSVLTSGSVLAGSFAHGTELGPGLPMLLSNSPECLYRVTSYKGENHLFTMPIKGTMKLSSKDSVEELWESLKNDPKERGELYMITDLLRNDLSRVSARPSEVHEKQLPLQAPGLLHAYSLVSTPLSDNLDLFSLVRGMFPGGSITGAPKKRTMQLLGREEVSRRGFYCGSTFLFHGEVRSASINIRTLSWDQELEKGVYGAGGGITLMSRCNSEYEEMIGKVDSFTRLFFRGNFKGNVLNLKKNAQYYSQKRV